MDRAAFFSRFKESEAVPYFYEPFLEAFDPALRRQLDVWYAPTEVVRYVVARVDKALNDDLGIPEGRAAENVYVLDPCCGTGAYLAEVLRCIARNLPDHGLDAPLAEDGSERAGVFLTNALTGWEPHTNKPLPFPELEEERDLAEAVKQDKPILVILGNPPYNGFAGGDKRNANSRKPTAPRSACARPKAKAYTISMCGSSAWRSGASPRRQGWVWSASSPTIPGWTACPSPGCASTTTRSGSTA